MKVAHLSGEPEESVTFRDGLGVRVAAVSEAGERLERFTLPDAFAPVKKAVQERVSRLQNLHHVRFARLRGFETTTQSGAPIVISSETPGRRLSDVLLLAGHGLVTVEMGPALQVTREVLAALAVLHDSRNVTHGSIAPERIVLSPNGRVVMVEHVLSQALDKLQLPRHQLWRDWRIATPPAAGPVRFDTRTDLAQTGVTILALLLGRPIDEDEYPHRLRTLLPAVRERLSESGASRIARDLQQWLERLLPTDGGRPFTSLKEAQLAFEALVSSPAASLGMAPARVKALLTACAALDVPTADPPALQPLDVEEAPDVVRVALVSDVEQTAQNRPPAPHEADDLDIEALLRLAAELEDQSDGPVGVSDASGPGEPPPAARTEPAPASLSELSSGVEQAEGLDALASERESLQQQFADLLAQVAPEADPAPAPQPPAAATRDSAAEPAPTSLVQDAIRWTFESVGDAGSGTAALVPWGGTPACEQDASAEHQVEPAGTEPMAGAASADDVADVHVWLTGSLARGPQGGSEPAVDPIDPADAESELLADPDNALLTTAAAAQQTPVDVGSDEAGATIPPVDIPAEGGLAVIDQQFVEESAAAVASVEVDVPELVDDAHGVIAEITAEPGEAPVINDLVSLDALVEAETPILTRDESEVAELAPIAIDAVNATTEETPHTPDAAADCPTLHVPQDAPDAAAVIPVVVEVAEGADLADLTEVTDAYFAVDSVEGDRAPVAPDHEVVVPIIDAVVETAEAPCVEAAPVVEVDAAVSVAAATEEPDGACPSADPLVVDVETATAIALDDDCPVAPADVAACEVVEDAAVEAPVEVAVGGEVGSAEVTALPGWASISADVETAVTDTDPEAAADATPLALDDDAIEVPVVVEQSEVVHAAAREDADAVAVDGHVSIAWATAEPDGASPSAEGALAEAGEAAPAARDAEDTPSETGTAYSFAGIVTFDAEAEAEVDDGVEIADAAGGDQAPAGAERAAVDVPTVADVAMVTAQAVSSKRRRSRRKARKSPTVVPAVLPAPEPVAAAVTAPAFEPAALPPARGLSLIDRDVPSWRPPADLRDVMADAARRVAVAPAPVEVPPPAAVATVLPIDAATAPPPAPAPAPPPPSVTVVAELMGAAPEPSRQPETRFRTVVVLSKQVNWRKTAAAAFIIAILETAAFGAAWWWVQPGAKGMLVVETSVPGVEVRLDGEFVGHTPFHNEVRPGRHTLTLKRGGLERSMPVEINLGVVTTQTLPWPRPSHGSLRVTSAPEGAEVVVGGRARGRTPLTIDDLAAGRQTLLLRGPSGTVSTTATVVAGETAVVDVPIFAGWVQVHAAVELVVSIGGARLGTSVDGPFLLSPGTHRVDVASEALGFTQTLTATVEPGRVRSLTVALPEVPLLASGADGDEVFVDGVSRGVLPDTSITVPVGTHEVVLRRADGSERRRTLTVRAGAPVSID